MFKLLLPLFQSPIRLLYTAWGFVFLCYWLSPFRFDEPWSIRTVCFVSGFFALFTIGYLLGKEFIARLHKGSSFQHDGSFCKGQSHLTYGYRERVHIRRKIKLNRFIVITAFVGLIGSFLLAADLLFLRGIDYSQGLSAARDLMNQRVLEQGGIPAGRGLSIVGRILSGFLPVAGMMVVFRSQFLPTSTSLLVLIMLLFQCLCELLSGGRNSIFIILVFLSMGILTKASTYNGDIWKSSKLFWYIKKIFPWLLSIFFIYAIYVFIEREALRGRAIIESYEHLQNAFLLDFSFNLDSLIYAQENPMLSSISLALVYLAIYIVHGLNELNLLCSQLLEPDFWYGFYNLFLPTLLLQKLGFVSSDLVAKIPNSIERTGVYLTALGSLYIDFGYNFSFAIFTLFGFCTGFAWKGLKIFQDNLALELICSYLLLTISISPFYLSISTGNGFQILAALVLICILLRLKALDEIQTI